MTKPKKKECICNDYDGSGVSTCGFPCPVHAKKPKPKKNWEERFDIEFVHERSLIGIGEVHATDKTLKDFISSLLSEQRKELRKKILEIQKRGYVLTRDFDDILKLI